MSPAPVEPSIDGPVWRWVHRVLLCIAVGFYFCVVYACMRGVLARVGSDPASIVPAAAATLAMAAFIVWLLPLADLPEIVARHAIPLRRFRRGACPTCGHDRTALPSGGRCPECGAAAVRPTAWAPGWSTVRRFAAILGLGWAVGVGAGETWTHLDERRFEQEAAMHRDSYVRRRAWPADFATLRHDPGRGIEAMPPFVAPRIEGWRPASGDAARRGAKSPQ
jgi:hypothetical protein